MRREQLQPPNTTNVTQNSRNGIKGIRSYICIRNRESLQLIQRISIPTRCINCIDGNGEDPPYFIVGDDEGCMTLLKRQQDITSSTALCNNDIYQSNPNILANDEPIYQVESLSRNCGINAELRQENLSSVDQSSFKEINDIRLTPDGFSAVAIRTLSRYPACLEIRDLITNKSQFYPPSEMRGYWIHAVEFSQAKSLNEIFAVGENSLNGTFGILQIDMRLPRKVASVFSQTRQMLWPLRVSLINNSIFANSFFPPNINRGTILEFDSRLFGSHSDPCSSRMYLSGCHSYDQQNDRFLNRQRCSNYMCQTTDPGIVCHHQFNDFRPEDFRCLHGHLYVYGTNGRNIILQRSSCSTGNNTVQCLGGIDLSYRLADNTDVLNADNRNPNTLKLFNLDDRGIVSSCGSSLYSGKLRLD